MADRRPSLSFTVSGGRRAVVVGAGSFGTAGAVVLTRAGMRTTLQTRTAEQAQALGEARENEPYLPGVAFQTPPAGRAEARGGAREREPYLPGVAFPRELRVEPMGEGLGRADLVF